MELLSLVLVVGDIACTLVYAYCVYLVLRFALSRVSEWRVSHGRREISARRALVFAVLAALSFII